MSQKLDKDPTQSSLLLSREMSHFLLRLQGIRDWDNNLKGVKRLDYGQPFITPFIIFDTILIDPSVGSFVDSLHPGVEQNGIYQLLSKDRSVRFTETSATEYELCVREGVKLAAQILSNAEYSFPESIQPDYLLETPLYLFFKESKAFADLVLKSVRQKSTVQLEEVAFIFSACYSAILGERMGKPVLMSRTGYKILEKIDSQTRQLLPQDSLAHKVFDEISREALNISNRVTFEVPQFSDVVVDDPNNLKELIEKTIEIRNSRGAELLRKKIAELLNQAKSGLAEPELLEASKDEVRNASLKLLEDIRPSREKYLKRFVVELILTSPTILLTYNSGLLGTLLGGVSKLLIDEIRNKISERKYGWFYFVFKNAPFTRLSLR